MTARDYNQIYMGFQGLAQNRNIARSKGRKFLNKIDRIRCGEDEELDSGDMNVLQEVDNTLHARLGERVHWSPN